MASLSYYCGGTWMNFPYCSDPRKPHIEVTHAEVDLVKFTLRDTDSSVANALRRIMLGEIPTLAIEVVNVEENDTVLFDEFIAHRLGLLPVACHNVGDIPPDEGFVDHKDCDCFDGCPYCTVEFNLDVQNDEDSVMNVTHFDMELSGRFKREDDTGRNKNALCPFPDASIDEETDHRDNGVLIAKLKKDQRIKMKSQARKGIPKYHSKFQPTATTKYQVQPVVTLDRPLIDSLTLDEKIDFVQSCPRKVFNLDIEDKVQVDKLNDCIYCDECVTKGKELGKKVVTVKQDTNTYHFTVEGVTKDGPRSCIDVVRAALRIFDYKMQLFVKDAYGDAITEWLPRDRTA